MTALTRRSLLLGATGLAGVAALPALPKVEAPASSPVASDPTPPVIDAGRIIWKGNGVTTVLDLDEGLITFTAHT